MVTFARNIHGWPLLYSLRRGSLHWVVPAENTNQGVLAIIKTYNQFTYFFYTENSAKKFNEGINEYPLWKSFVDCPKILLILMLTVTQ